mgnify:FL=1
MMDVIKNVNQYQNKVEMQDPLPEFSGGDL